MREADRVGRPIAACCSHRSGTSAPSVRDCVELAEVNASKTVASVGEIWPRVLSEGDKASWNGRWVGTFDRARGCLVSSRVTALAQVGGADAEVPLEWRLQTKPEGLGRHSAGGYPRSLRTTPSRLAGAEAPGRGCRTQLNMERPDGNASIDEGKRQRGRFDRKSSGNDARTFESNGIGAHGWRDHPTAIGSREWASVLHQLRIADAVPIVPARWPSTRSRSPSGARSAQGATD